MHKIRGAHFVLAFLAVILLPGFLGAAELPDYQKYTGPIKPGVVITKANWDTYLPELKKLLPPSKLQWMSKGINEGLVTMPIVETTYVPQTKGMMEATRKYAGTARVGADNQLLNWTAGFPFPDPKNARELAWNCYPTINRSHAHDDIQFIKWFGLFQGSKYEKHFVWNYYDRKYKGRTDIAPLGDMAIFKEKDIIVKQAMVIVEPNEVKGFIQFRVRYWDIDKPDEVYGYIPALRRLRRLTGSDCTDPMLGSDVAYDDFEVWRQKFDSKMTLRVLEYRDFLVPKTYVGKKDHYYDYKKTGPFFQVEWELRPQWVLEIMINNPNYLYSKRVVYFDGVPLDKGGCYMIYWGEQYDQKGRLWKANGPGSPAAYKGFHNAFQWIFMNCLTDHYTAMTGPAAYDEDFDKIYPINEEETLTIKGLLKRGR